MVAELKRVEFLGKIVLAWTYRARTSAFLNLEPRIMLPLRTRIGLHLN